jgi:hypothetical protein
MALADPAAPAAAVVDDVAAAVVVEPYPDVAVLLLPVSPDGAEEQATSAAMAPARVDSDSPVVVRMKRLLGCTRSGRCIVGSASVQRQCVTRPPSG